MFIDQIAAKVYDPVRGRIIIVQIAAKIDDPVRSRMFLNRCPTLGAVPDPPPARSHVYQDKSFDDSISFDPIS